MHDNVIQRLFATGMSLQSAAPMSDPERPARSSTRAVDELDAAIKDIRHTIFALHRVPGRDRSRAEIATICGDAAVTLGFSPGAAALRAHRPTSPKPSPPTCWPCVREALSNVARHASASLGPVSVAGRRRRAASS